MEKYVKKISEYIAFIGLGGLIALSLVILVDIVGRELLGMPIPGFSDITGQLIIIAAAGCFPASFADRSHICVRFVGQITHWRVREALDLLGSVATFIILGIIAFQLRQYASDVWTNNETTWLIGIPIWPVWWLVTGLLTVSFIIQVIMARLQLKRLFSPVKLADLDSIADVSETTLSNEARKDV
ncbi:TRAP transporter small permease [bacterium]|nr:TRAP transporter small permease [bacterium]